MDCWSHLLLLSAVEPRSRRWPRHQGRRTPMRWLVGAGLAIMLLAALSVEAFASRCPGGNLLDRVAPLSQGLYSPEYSTTFPGPHGATARFYRWTQPSSLVPIWPSLMSSGTVSLEYLAPQPQGKVFLSLGS